MKLALATLLLAACIPAYIPGVSYPDTPEWDCAIAVRAACGSAADDAPSIQKNATQCQATLKDAPHPTFRSACRCDVNGLVTCIPSVRTVALQLRRAGLTMKAPVRDGGSR